MTVEAPETYRGRPIFQASKIALRLCLPAYEALDKIVTLKSYCINLMRHSPVRESVSGIDEVAYSLLGNNATGYPGGWMSALRGFRHISEFSTRGMITRAPDVVPVSFCQIQVHALTSDDLMDYFANALPTPPEWVGRIGLEWLYRLWNEPGRLGHRYLVEPWQAAFDIYHNRSLQSKLPSLAPR